MQAAGIEPPSRRRQPLPPLHCALWQTRGSRRWCRPGPHQSRQVSADVHWHASPQGRRHCAGSPLEHLLVTAWHQHHSRQPHHYQCCRCWLPLWQSARLLGLDVRLWVPGGLRQPHISSQALKGRKQQPMPCTWNQEYGKAWSSKGVVGEYLAETGGPVRREWARSLVLGGRGGRPPPTPSSGCPIPASGGSCMPNRLAPDAQQVHGHPWETHECKRK